MGGRFEHVMSAPLQVPRSIATWAKIVMCHKRTLRRGTKASRRVQPDGRLVRQNGFSEGTMRLHRRSFLHLAATTALSTASRSARAQTYPTHPITMIVPTSPGTGFDAWTRIVAERMRGSLKQPIIVENIPGADGNLGTGRAARAFA